MSFVAMGQSRNQSQDLPLTAKAAIQELDRTIQQAKKKAVDKLKTAMKNEMQMGNLERANRINQAVLRISEIPDNSLAGASPDPVTGDWQTRTGVVFTFDKNQGIRCGNGWSGTWKMDDEKVFVVLNTLNGQLQPSVNQYYYAQPVVKKGDGQEDIVMAAQPGYEDQTLYRKR